ncbi:MAG TPA: hypothetical protein ENI17_16225 [Pseudomonas xinjiangensis]|uniref:Uncharacterized protein n=2 Tax=root TaxID=1 RepID=A0A7V1FR27_9GAMM|nr:hypothetical protein [Halopseudomonas xinjiangensis]HEC49149.1 hypothetical protein [Halopseudomonas xinjiangensis]
MRHRHLIAFLTPLVFALPAAADWPEGAKDRFVQECIASAQANNSAVQAQSYCACAADKVSSEFSEAELEAMGRQSPMADGMRQRLVEASRSCNADMQE